MIQCYKYQKATHPQVVRAAKWAINTLQLRDWQIDVLDSRLQGTNVGSSEVYINSLCAKVIIDMDKCKISDENCIATVIHEIFHIALFHWNMNGDDERWTCMVEPILFKLWCYEHGKDIPPVRDVLRDEPETKIKRLK